MLISLFGIKEQSYERMLILSELFRIQQFITFLFS